MGGQDEFTGRYFSSLFYNLERYMVLVHCIMKKSKKTPKQDLDLAKKRRDIVLAGGVTEDE